ncbi:MAG: dipeptidase [Bacillota bacterium]|nr:dipeptidase [Bacillota bacterium]
MIIDMHCDTILVAYRNHKTIEIQKFLEGNIKIQFFALFPGSIHYPNWYLHRVLDMLDFCWEQFEAQRTLIEVITSPADLSNCIEGKKIGALLAIEGGEVLEGNLRILRVLYRLGIRSLGLTWNHRNEIADGIAESQTGGGLTKFGRQVVKEMNRLGMIIDVSHLAEKGFWDVLELSDHPVIASHSNCRTIWNHPRNLSDEQIKGLAENKGIVGINFVPDFLGPAGAGLNDLLKHIDHICTLVGDDFLGFGSDFDGTDFFIPEIQDARHFPKIIETLQKWGYPEGSIRKICRENCLRVLKEVLNKT